MVETVKITEDKLFSYKPNANVTTKTNLEETERNNVNKSIHNTSSLSMKHILNLKASAGEIIKNSPRNTQGNIEETIGSYINPIKK